MKIKLSKFVGRDQLPGDKVAFDRISKAFEGRGNKTILLNGEPMPKRSDRDKPKK
jgi:hypothetical protein